MSSTDLRTLLKFDPTWFDRPLPDFLQGLVDESGHAFRPLSELRQELIDGHFEVLNGLPVLRHPLLVSVPATEVHSEALYVSDDLQGGSMMAYALDPVVRYLFTARRALEKLSERDFHMFIFTIERPFRLDALYWLATEDMLDQMTPKDHAKLVFAVFQDSEAPGVNRALWLDLMLAAKTRLKNEAFSDHPSGVEGLPDMLTIYRGTDCPERELGSLENAGLSWTLDREKALWFSRRWSSTPESPEILCARVHRRDIIGYITGCDESEVIVSAVSLLDVTIEPEYPSDDNEASSSYSSLAPSI